MKRVALLVGAVSLFAWGISGALAGCGGDDGAVADTSEAGAASSSGGSSGTTSGSSSGGSSTSSSGGTGDGGTDGGGGEGGTDGGGGFTSNPNRVTCGATECATPAQLCCRGFGGGDAGCVNTNANCQGNEIECDEKADCPTNEVCCQGINGNRCNNNCGGGSFQTCKTNTECDGGQCKEWTCNTAGGGGTLKLRACAMPFAGCTAQ